MKVKVGDTVLVIAGADKGKKGIVTKTIKEKNRVIVEGINMVKRHTKGNGYNISSAIIEKEAPIHVSNVKVVGYEPTKLPEIEKGSGN